MEWTIYSIGDAAFLEAILNGIAMMNNDDSLLWLGAIGLLIGVLIVFWQSILGGAKEINLQHSFVALVLFYVMFGQTARVYIEDVRSGAVRQVDNVPWGVAAAGGIISQLGYNITEKMEQAFGNAKMTDDGFGTPLYLLLKVRDASFGKAGTDAAGDGDLHTSIKNYITDCTLVAIDMGETNPREITEDSTNLVNAIRFNSPVYSTMIQLPGDASPAEHSCAAAWDRINALVTSASWRTRFNEHMSSTLGVTGSPATAVTDAFTAINQTVADGQTYMLNAVLKNIMFEAENADSASQGSAIISTGAIEKLRVQNAAEANLFFRMAKPLQTFIEGFVYALTPFMAILLAMGPFGIKLVGKYFAVLIWIQLWVPVMSIVNLYMHMSVEGSLNNLTAAAGSDVDLSSIAGMTNTFAVAADYVSVAGMLAAATPMLTLMIVYGSAVAATSLAGRLTPKDTINEGIVSPDVAQNKALLTNESRMLSDSMSGMRAFGASSVGGKLSFGQESQEVASSSHQRMTAAQSGFMQSVGSTIGSSWSDAVQSGATQSFSRGMSADMSHSHGMVQNLANSASKDYGLSSDQKNILAAHAAFGAGMGLEGKVLSQFQGVDTSKVQEAYQNMRSQVESSNWQSQFAEAMKSDIAQSQGQTFSNVESQSEMESLQKTAAETVSASNAYNEVSSWASKIGTTQDVDTFQAKTAISQLPGGQQKLENLAAAGGVADWARNTSYSVAGTGMFKGLDQDETASLLMVQALGGIGGPTNLSHQQQMNNMDNLKGLLTESGVITNNTTAGGAYSNAGIDGPVGGAKGVVETGFDQSFAGAVGDVLARGVPDSDEVRNFHQENNGDLRTQAVNSRPTGQMEKLWSSIEQYANQDRAPVGEQLANLGAGSMMIGWDTVQKDMMAGSTRVETAANFGKQFAVEGASQAADFFSQYDATAGWANNLNKWASNIESGIEYKTPEQFYQGMIQEAYSEAKDYGMDHYGLNEAQANAYAHYATNPLERGLLNRPSQTADFGSDISDTEVQAIRSSLANGNDHVLQKMGQLNDLRADQRLTPLNEGPAHTRFAPS